MYVVNEIIESVRESRLIKDPFFKSCSVVLTRKGEPYMFGGGFSQVFQLEKESQKWAFKVWVQEITDNEKRYSILKEYLGAIQLPYFIDFEYVSKGLVVNGNHIPTLRMPWVTGALLKFYINENIDNRDKLNELADNFLKMTKDLHAHSISHGDLKSDNIYVTQEGGIKLIDYDSICIPSLENENDVCVGTLGYQHPMRAYHGHSSSIKVDYFSELVIYLSIKAVAENPLLWEKYYVMAADYRLLFTPEDFLYFQRSAIRNDLMTLSEEIKLLVRKLDDYLASHLFLEAI